MIKTGTVVGLAYTLTDTSGNVIDRAEGKDPFYYLHGASQIIAGLEQALQGLSSGDKKKVTIPPTDGYGEVDENLRMVIRREAFAPNQQLEVGMRFHAELSEGEPVVFTILEFDDEKVKVDGNHPLAGTTLHFDVEVLSVRDATPEEIEHGHAHEGAHHH